MTLHDEFVEQLKAVASSVRLVASLKDARLNFAAADDIRIFVPDLHIVSNKQRTRYRYGTNDMELLADILTRIASMKARGGRTVAVYQIGDFLDLWREEPVPSLRRDAASRIVSDHPTLMNALFSPSLKARFLLGNHDVDLAWWPNFTAWERRYFLPPRGSTKISGLALHGDVFDWVEMLPDIANRFFVYFFSPFAGAQDYDLKDVATVVSRENKKRDFSNGIGGLAELGALAELGSAGAGSHNLGTHPFLDKARATACKANQAYGMDLRFAVIGHSHHARIAVHDGQDGFFALIDCGAWLEKGRDSAGSEFPNQQITALSENEFRIYQVER